MGGGGVKSQKNSGPSRVIMCRNETYGRDFVNELHGF